MREEFTIDARTTTPLSRTSTRSSRPPVSAPFRSMPSNCLLQPNQIHESMLNSFIVLGGKLTIQYLKKTASNGPAGVPRLMGSGIGRLTRTKRTVARPYGGKLGHAEVRDK